MIEAAALNFVDAFFRLDSYNISRISLCVYFGNNHVSMNMDLLEEIQKEIAKFRSLEKANEHVKKVKYEIDKSYAELLTLEKQLDKEYKDYEKLEGKSLKGFFYNVLGSKEDQLEKERQEYLQLSLRYDETKESIKLQEFELKVLQKKVDQYQDSFRRLNTLKKKREAYLLRTNTADGVKLRKIIDQMDAATRLSTDIDEALKVGNDLIVLLNNMIKLLRNARNWGRWDMHGGSNRQYKYHKHSNIDRAKKVAYQIQTMMAAFEREVRDVYPDFQGLQTNFDLDRFNGFTDLFFDNLISDWIVQQKIVNSLNNVKAIHDRIMRLLQSLKVDKDKLTHDYNNLTKAKNNLIMGK